MGFDKTDTLIYINFGNNKIADKRLRDSGGEHLFETSAIVHLSHKRGADELIHRSIKELATKEHTIQEVWHEPCLLFPTGNQPLYFRIIQKGCYDKCYPKNVIPEHLKDKID